MRPLILTTIAGAILALTVHTEADAQLRILYLSKSASFEHIPVRRDNGQPSLSERVLTQLAEEHGARITCTKDASLINAENLNNYDVVVFYTTGVLTEAGLDQQPPMGEKGLDELIAWVENGGGFVGIHAATDTWGTPGDQEPNTYTRFIGGTFAGHGDQFQATVKVVDPDHPAAKSLPQDWALHEEWYTFRHLDTKNMHVIAYMDPGDERQKQPIYNTPGYPVVWCKAVGKGRMYYTALGHKRDVWNDPTFQSTVVDAVGWASGDGPLDADPNYDETVPKP